MPSPFYNVGELRALLATCPQDAPIYIHYEKNYEDGLCLARELDGAVLLIPIEKLKELSSGQNLEFKKICSSKFETCEKL